MILSNNTIVIEVAEHGAELVSLKKKGREYLWGGDPSFWNRHAPILFPAVGKPFNNELHIGGKTYVMKQHGFARDSSFMALGDGRLMLVPDDHSDQYPYSFSLEAQYRLLDSSVEIIWTVTNLDSRNMYFQIGAHPGFLLPDYNADDSSHGSIRFYDRDANPVSPVIVSALDDGNRIPLLAPRHIPHLMHVTSDTFAHDALIFEDAQVAAAVLCDKLGKPVLSVRCPQADAFGIWAPHKPRCPFLCLEPWCGICDAKGFVGDIGRRTYCHLLAPKAQYRFSYSIDIIEQ